MASRLPALAPFGAMLDDPIGQRSLESNVATGLLRFNPLVPQDFLAFRLKLPIERRVLQQITRRGRLFRFVRHNREYKFYEHRILTEPQPVTTLICELPRLSANGLPPAPS